MKNAKRIDFRFTIKGTGVVNFDDSDQKYMYLHSNFNNAENTSNRRLWPGEKNNVNYAKKNFTIDADGSLNFKLKISDNCLRNAIFEKDAVAHHSGISHFDKLLYNYLGSPGTVLRGYFLTKGKGQSSINRKAPLFITYAEQTNNAVSHIEVHTKSGEKDMRIEKKDNSIFSVETVGEIEYAGHGSINLQELQFLSADQQFGRLGFDPDKFGLFATAMKRYFPNFQSELKYFLLKTSVIELPEQGALFSNDEVIELVRNFFNRLLYLDIVRRTGRATMSTLEYRIINDPIEAMQNPNQGWKKLTSQSDIDNIKFTVEPSYVEFDKKTAQQTINSMKENRKLNEIEGELMKEAKQKARKEAKEKARKKTTETPVTKVLAKKTGRIKK